MVIARLSQKCQSTPFEEVEIRVKISGKIEAYPHPEKTPLAKFERHVFVCTYFREPGSARPSCTTDGKGELHAQLKDAVRAAGLVASIRINKAGCLDQCEHGPTIVVYPEAVWYGQVKVEDVPEIISEHLIAGHPVERLRIADECLNAAVCSHRPALAVRG
jgi:(2Fe-2S) ferredoxin